MTHGGFVRQILLPCFHMGSHPEHKEARQTERYQDREKCVVGVLHPAPCKDQTDSIYPNAWQLTRLQQLTPWAKEGKDHYWWPNEK